LGEAAVTLMPVRWDEPFGLVAVESLATGTPVVAFRRGGLTEILDERALVAPDDVDAFASAAEEAVGRDPLACRMRAERFALPAMIDRYQALYASLA
jgi:glycosyltransferase involved in cell wall biosynthesis